MTFFNWMMVGILIGALIAFVVIQPKTTEQEVRRGNIAEFIGKYVYLLAVIFGVARGAKRGSVINSSADGLIVGLAGGATVIAYLVKGISFP